MTVKAALDIGSNSIKLLVLEVSGDGSYKILHDQYTVTGLGSGLATGGNLLPKAVEESLQCITDMVGTAQAFGVSEVLAAGTAALRNAADAGKFVERVLMQTGVQIQVISANDEARLSRAVALRELQGVARQVVFFDIGGGSTELTWCAGEDVTQLELLPLGARQLTEAAQVEQPVTNEMEHRLATCINAEFSKLELSASGMLAGLGGTAVTLTRLLNLEGWGADQDTAIVKVDSVQVSNMLNQLRSMTMGQVEALLSFDAKRAPVIFAGAYLLNEVLTRFEADEFLLVDRGLRYGLLLAN